MTPSVSSFNCKHFISSCECTKVVADILTNIIFINRKYNYLSLSQVTNQNIYNLMTENDLKKTLKRQRKFEHKMASPEKLQKCRYDFLAFTRRHYHLLCFVNAMKGHNFFIMVVTMKMLFRMVTF